MVAFESTSDEKQWSRWGPGNFRIWPSALVSGAGEVARFKILKSPSSELRILKCAESVLGL
jgi:hypothetical protein